MSVQASHNVCQIIFRDNFWWNSMIFQHFVHLSQVHRLFSIFHIFKTSYCFDLESSCWIFCVQEFEQSLKLFETKFNRNCIPVFFFFVNIKRVINYFVDVECFFKLTDCWKIWCDARSKCRNFRFLSDSERDYCSWKSWCHCFLNLSLIVKQFILVNMTFHTELHTSNVDLLPQFWFLTNFLLSDSHLSFFFIFQLLISLLLDF